MNRVTNNNSKRNPNASTQNTNNTHKRKQNSPENNIDSSDLYETIKEYGSTMNAEPLILEQTTIVQQMKTQQEIKRSKDHFTDTFALYIIISSLPSYITVVFLLAFFLATNSKKILSNILIFLFVPYKYFEHGKILQQEKNDYLNKRKETLELENISFIGRFKMCLLSFLNRVFYENKQKSFIKIFFLLISELIFGFSLFKLKSTFFYFIERFFLAVISSSLIVTTPKSCIKLSVMCLVLHHFYIFLFNKIISYNPSEHFTTSNFQNFQIHFNTYSTGIGYLESGSFVKFERIAKTLSLMVAFHIMYYEMLVTLNLFKGSPTERNKKKKQASTFSSQGDVIFNSKIVKDSKYQNIRIKTPVEYNSQTIIPEQDLTNEQKPSSTGHSHFDDKNKNKRNRLYEQHINDFHEINLLDDALNDYNSLNNKNFSFLKNKMVIKNMENYIYSIFNWNQSKRNSRKFNTFQKDFFVENQTDDILKEEGISPLWKIFTSYTIMRNEGKLLHLQKLNDSVFNERDDIDCKSLVLYNNSTSQESDYHKFNWADIYNSDRNLNEKIEGIAVVIYKISETYVQFLIQQPENYSYDNDEIVILVNGVIWYRVKSQISSMGELVTIQGLMASYIYDIQFVIRDHSIGKDFLIGDSIVRTSIGDMHSSYSADSKTQTYSSDSNVSTNTGQNFTGNLNSNLNTNNTSSVNGVNGNSNNMSNSNNGGHSSNSGTGFSGATNSTASNMVDQSDLLRDFSFPSFYHRRFASPIVTLKNSVLTTNSNINEERNKLKKMKKDFAKRLHSLKQEELSLTAKIKKIDHSNKGEASRITSKIDNLKKTIQSSEETIIPKLEDEIKILEASIITESAKYGNDQDQIDDKYLKFTTQKQSVLDELEVLKSDYSMLKKKQSKLESKLELSTKTLHYLSNDYDIKTENGVKLLEIFEEENKYFDNYIEFLKNQEDDLLVNVKILEQNILRIYNENQSVQKSLERLTI